MSQARTGRIQIAHTYDIRLEACLQVNAALQRYRSRYAASDEAMFYNQR
ncbi:MAG: hypothetical protein ACFBSF_20235 [Leptolyngbyaceae cyanobacterium]